MHPKGRVCFIPCTCLKYMAASILQDTHCTGKTGKMVKKKIPDRENTGDVKNLPKHREFGLLKL